MKVVALVCKEVAKSMAIITEKKQLFASNVQKSSSATETQQII